MPSRGISGSYVSLIPSFLRNLHTGCISSDWWEFTFPPTVQKCSLFSTSSPEFVVYRFFDGGHSDRWGDTSLWFWFAFLVKLGFLMSHGRKNSMRDKVIGKKWIYLERIHSIDRMRFVSKSKRPWGERHSTDRVWAISEGEKPWNMECLVLGGWIISLDNEWEDYSNYFREDVGIPRN